MTDSNRRKMVLIDGNGLAYRAFYALPPLKTSRGEAMNAVYGFTNMLYQILETEKPDYVGVAFDKSKSSKRSEMFEEYKAHRQKMPEDLAEQFPFIEEVVSTMKIPIFYAEGYEADDCIATLTRMAEEKGAETLIYSGDLDMLQLVSDSTQVVTTRRGISDLVVYNVGMVKKRYGIQPRQLVDYKALAGDSSDHIPGIPGIGEASASKLLNLFDKIETMYEEPERIPSRWRKQILENQDQAYLSKKLASLNMNLELDHADWDSLSLKEPDRDELKHLFIKLEFKSMLKKLGYEDSETNEIQEIAVMIVGKEEDMDLMADKLGKSSYYSQFWMLDNRDLVGLAVSEEDSSSYYFPFILPDNINISSTFGISTFSRDRVFHEMRPMVESDHIIKFVFDLSSGIPFLKRGEYFTGRNFFDIMIAGFLLEPENPPKKLESILSRYSNLQLKTIEEIVGFKSSRKKISPAEVPLQDLSLFSAGRAVRINKIGPVLLSRLKETGLYDVFNTLDVPIVSVLSALETRGVKIDKVTLQQETIKTRRSMEAMEKEIYEMAGCEINLNSTRQVGKVLFETLKIKGGEKSATGYKTGADVLEKLTDSHPIIGKILEHKEIARKFAFLEGLSASMDPMTAKIRISFHQINSPLGRITSSNPNLGSIPEEYRKLFVPTNPERTLMSFDYADLGMRILAHLSGDEKMKAVFEGDRDIFRETAGAIFEIAPETATHEQTETAREICNGIMNGLSAHALSQALNVERGDIKKYMASFYEYFSAVKTFEDNLVKKVREQEYAETLLGRRRYLPNINSRNKNMRSSAEKTAISVVVQGTVADVMKKAIIEIFEGILRNHRDIHLLLVISHQMIFEAKKRRAEKYSAELTRILENIISLSVPVRVRLSEGANWGSLEEKMKVLA